VIYLLLFATSLLCLWVSLNHSGWGSKFFLSLSVILPCLLAGLRGTHVGTDMQVYIVGFFNLAVKSDSFGNYTTIVGLNDYLYLAVNYLVSRFTNLLWIELFIQQALVIMPIYYTFFRVFNNKRSIMLGASLYFLFMYNLSLNISRQSIALAFEILGFSYFGKNNKKFLTCVIVSILFHNTAVITLIPFFLFWLFNSKKFTNKFKFFISFCGCIGCTLIIYFFTNLLPLLSESRILFLRRISGYTRYLKQGIDISTSGFFLCLVCIIFTFLYRKKTSNFCFDVNFFPVLALLGSILFQTGSIISYSQRASYYFLYPVVLIAFPHIVSETSKSQGILHPQRWLLLFFMSWWIFNIIINNVHETLPYVFFFE
jgi:hypothetical protein